MPEVVEAFFEIPRSAGGHLALKKAPELDPGLPSDPAAAAQEFPPHLLELGRHRLAVQSGALSSTHLVHRLVQMLNDVKAIQDVQGLAGLLRHHLEIGLPHVTADVTQTAHQRRAQHLQPGPQGGLGSPTSHPQEPPAMAINLIDDRQETVGSLALAPMDFVNANRSNSLQHAMGQSPLHEPFHRVINGSPTGWKGPSRLSPGKSPRPAGQKSHHRGGHRPLALVPGDMLDSYSMLRALHSARTVEEMDDDST